MGRADIHGLAIPGVVSLPALPARCRGCRNLRLRLNLILNRVRRGKRTRARRSLSAGMNTIRESNPVIQMNLCLSFGMSNHNHCGYRGQLKYYPSFIH